MPPRSIAESLVEALADVPVEGRRVLVARASEARDVLPDALRERGAEVDVLPLYDTVAEQLTDAQLAAAARADYVTFTSSSTVRFFTAGRRPGERRARRLDRPGRRAGPRASSACRSTSRPSATTSTAWSTRCSRDAAR